MALLVEERQAQFHSKGSSVSTYKGRRKEARVVEKRQVATNGGIGTTTVKRVVLSVKQY